MQEVKLNFFQKIIIAAQHLFTMAPASMVVPLILGNSLGLRSEDMTFLISANFFVNGIAVLFESVGLGNRIGSRLPIVFGASFAPLAPMIIIGDQYGIATVFGAILGSAIIMYILSFFLDRILKFFPPVVMGSFITLIGISLAPIAMTDLAGGEDALNYGSIENLVIGLIVIVIVLLLSSFGRGFLKSTSIIIGIVIGTLITLAIGNLDMTEVSTYPWFELIKPFKFGIPDFKISSIIIMTIFSIVNMIQCVGAFSLYGEVTGDRMNNCRISNSARTQIAAQAIGGVFSAVPTTAFNGNIGLIGMTNIKNRSVIVITGIMLVVIGMVPKLAAVVTAIPKPVLGGATVVVFGIILASGISMLSRVDYSDRNNITIVGTSLSVGIGASFTEGVFVQLPETLAMLLGDGLFMVSIVAIVLNIVLNRDQYFN